MVKIEVGEFLDGDIAVRIMTISLFNFVIFKRIDTTTNNEIVANLKVLSNKQIKGFTQ